MKFTLELELKSAASPGSGEGWAGMIDNDIVFDEFGLPYIPARRIKGILREMALDVVSAFELSLGKDKAPFTLNDVKRLFGDVGQKQATAIAFGNACLEDHEEQNEWLQWAREFVPHLASPDNVIDTFTHVRTQTKIDDETGTAEAHSLRQTRVLNAGYRFLCAIDFGHEDENLLKLLALAVHVTRSLGGKRNRGLGAIQCTLKGLDKNVLDQYKEILSVEDTNGKE